jgi:CheY-like chemotaxis protein
MPPRALICNYTTPNNAVITNVGGGVFELARCHGVRSSSSPQLCAASTAAARIGPIAPEYCFPVAEPLRLAIGEDDVLLREGIVRLVSEAGFEVAAQTGDADDFLRRALAHRPDVAVVDVQMPPGQGDDGLRAAIELRRQRPDTGVLVLSQFYEEQYAVDLIGESAEGSATSSGSAWEMWRRSSRRSPA